MAKGPSLNYVKLIIFYLLCAYMTIGMPCSGLSGPNMEEDWLNLETRYTVVKFKSIQDLKQFEYKLKYGPGQDKLFGLFSRNPDYNNLKASVAAKIDAIFERVQEILDMRKPMDKVGINIYPNTAQLHRAYTEIYGTKCRIRAWYRFRNNTVYVNVKDLHERMLAHELAHAIIDHYLSVRPPRATAEILARYVDIHLK